MDRRTTGIIATIAATLLCGCPGLFALCWGLLAAVVSFIPGADIDIGGSSDPRSALVGGIGAICAGVFFIAIPIVIGFLMLRNRPATAAAPVGVYPPPAPYTPPAPPSAYTPPPAYTPPAVPPVEPPAEPPVPPSDHPDEPLPPTS